MRRVNFILLLIYDVNNLRSTKRAKIDSAKKYFEVIKVNYKEVAGYGEFERENKFYKLDMANKKYNSKRPYIKTSIKREVKIEARHRCIICKETSVLETHHIDGNRNNNSTKNLICLCANCHHRADVGPVTRKELIDYKDKANEEIEEIKRLKKKNENLEARLREEISKSETNRKFKGIKAKYENIADKLINKLIYYNAFVYFLEPFYIDKRGEVIRQKLQKLFGLSLADEKFILEKLLESRMVKQVGNMVYVNNKDDVKVIINELLNKGEIKLAEVVNMFLYE